MKSVITQLLAILGVLLMSGGLLLGNQDCEDDLHGTTGTCVTVLDKQSGQKLGCTMNSSGAACMTGDVDCKCKTQANGGCVCQ